MIVSISQPAYLAWLGYYERLSLSDLHIVLDNVEIGTKSFTNRNKIRVHDGWTWLTVPVSNRGEKKHLPIRELEISDSKWQRKHWQSLCLNYSRAPHFKDHAPFFEAFFAQEWHSLSDMIRESNTYLMQCLGLTTPLQYSYEMQPQQTKDTLILELCLAVGASTYISGPFGREYLDESKFTAMGIEVIYHDYKHPVYSQNFSGFEPFMSIIDLLFMQGHQALNILKTDSKQA